MQPAKPRPRMAARSLGAAGGRKARGRRGRWRRGRWMVAAGAVTAMLVMVAVMAPRDAPAGTSAASGVDSPHPRSEHIRHSIGREDAVVGAPEVPAPQAPAEGHAGRRTRPVPPSPPIVLCSAGVERGLQVLVKLSSSAEFCVRIW